MLADFVASNWNDILTVLAFGIAAITGYYQVQHYRSQRPEIKIRSVEDAYYWARREEQDDYGDYLHIQEKSPENYNDLLDTRYRFRLKVDNDGFEPATIQEGSLILDDTGEELALVDSMYCGPDIPDGYTLMIKFEANQPRDIIFSTTGNPRDESEAEVSGMIRFDTTAGPVKEPVTFTLTS